MSEAFSTDLTAVMVPPDIAADPEHFFEKIAAVAPSILYIFDLEKMGNLWANRSLFDHLGYTEGEVQAMGSSILESLMHPEDFKRYPEHFAHLLSLDRHGTSKFEYRMQHKDGHWVWLHSHEAPYAWAEDGTVSRIIGSAHDITDIKNASAEVELISSELRHRVSNIFSVVGALVSMTGRRTPQARDAFEGLTARLGALAKAHQVAFSGEESTDVSARMLLEQTLAPYRRLSRLEITAQEAMIAQDAASSVALIIHELATNAVKYGGLRTAEGRLDVTLAHDSYETHLTWRETCVPPLSVAQLTGSEVGFGSRMIDLSVKQIGGRFSREITAEGLAVTLAFPSAGTS